MKKFLFLFLIGLLIIAGGTWALVPMPRMPETGEDLPPVLTPTFLGEDEGEREREQERLEREREREQERLEREREEQERKQEIERAKVEIEEIKRVLEQEIGENAQETRKRIGEDVAGIIGEIERVHEITIMPEIIEEIKYELIEDIEEKIEELGDKTEEIKELEEEEQETKQEKQKIEQRIIVFEKELAVFEQVDEQRIKQEMQKVGIEIGVIAPDGIRDGMKEIRQDIQEALVDYREERDEIIKELEGVVREKQAVEREKVELVIEPIKERLVVEIAREIEQEIEKELIGEDLEIAGQKVRQKTEEMKEQIMFSIEEMEIEIKQIKEAQIVKISNIKQDTDGDGLSDEEEIKLGTSIVNPDTDEDGFLDGVEVKHGFNPIDPVVEAEVVHQSPKQVALRKIDVYIVERTETVILPDERIGVKISGRGLPNSYVTLFIFSEPVIVTVRTDRYGKWSYVFEGLEDGKHEVFVTDINNRGGIEARSLVLPFVLAGENVAALPYIAKVAAMPIEEIKMSYLVLTLLIIILGLVIGLVIIRMVAKKKKTREI